MNTTALITLWNLTQRHPGTSGAEVAARVLLGLYNGPRFPLDLTELRRLDSAHLEAALEVIGGDASRPVCEVHQWLNRLTGSYDFGARFEHLAYDYRLRGRCKRADLPAIDPAVLIVSLPEVKDPGAASLVTADMACA